MITFGFKNYETKYPNWARHHKTIGLHVKRVYDDGEVLMPEKDQELKKLILENEDALKQKNGVMTVNEISGERRNATDYYLPLQNLQYKEANIDYYSVGAMNTKQTTHVRLIFVLEYDKCVLDYKYNSESSFAMSFYDLLDTDGIEDIIENILKENKPLEEVGIAKGEEGYHVVLVTNSGEIIDADVEKYEFLNSIVAIEIYDFEQIID